LPLENTDAEYFSRENPGRVGSWAWAIAGEVMRSYYRKFDFHLLRVPDGNASRSPANYQKPQDGLQIFLSGEVGKL
jgi:hypothetical protein